MPCGVASRSSGVTLCICGDTSCFSEAPLWNGALEPLRDPTRICFLSSEPMQDGRPRQGPSQLPPTRLHPRDHLTHQVQGDVPWGEGRWGGVQERHWRPVVDPSPPSAEGPSGAEASLQPGCLHCGSWAGGVAPCHGHHPPFQLTSGPAPPGRPGSTLRSRWPGPCQTL